MIKATEWQGTQHVSYVAADFRVATFAEEIELIQGLNKRWVATWVSILRLKTLVPSS